MKLFSFLKKQKEVIDIDIPEGPVHKSQNVAKDEEIYYERVEVKEQYSLSEIKGIEGKKNKLKERREEFEKKVTDLYHSYSFLRLFAKAADKDKYFNEKMILIDKSINRIKKQHEDYKRKSDLIKYVDLNEDELETINSSLNALFNFYDDLNKEINKVKTKYYKHLKMTSFGICSDKSYQELDNINKNINQFISEYKNINDAYDFIYYNSGSLIVDTVKALMECIENSNNEELKSMYKYNYFLDSDFVVAFSFPEWVELFTKIKYVMRTASKVELFDYLKFKKLYDELETRYILMLIHSEMRK